MYKRKLRNISMECLLLIGRDKRVNGRLRDIKRKSSFSTRVWIEET